MKILLVEDDMEISAMLKSFLLIGFRLSRQSAEVPS